MATTLAPKTAAPTPASNAAAASFASLVDKLDYLGAEGIEQVRRAYKFADEAHLGVTRRSGEPYITHPIAVALQCTDWKLDSQALMAALLHDVMEDCGVSKTDLLEKFGPTVAELVDGVTKLTKLQLSNTESQQAENFRKLFMAMSRDSCIAGSTPSGRCGGLMAACCRRAASAIA
jgi:GTP pyrophosphokinase